jgi:cytochrome c biogenesis protein CcmG/thiol:disulfide interchange protein DsbE
MTDTFDFNNPNAQPQPQQKSGGLGAGSIAVIAAIVVAAAIFGFALFQQSQTQPTDGKAPDFEFTTFDGETMRLSDLRGKVVVLNFWASWCIPCKDEAPELRAAWQRYDENEVVFLGIAYADNGPRSMAFMENYGLNYLNAPDLGTRISELYNIQGVPETFIIDKDGSVAEFIYAGVTREQLYQVIDPLLGA